MARPLNDQNEQDCEGSQSISRRLTLLLSRDAAGGSEIEYDEFINYCRNDPERLWQLVLAVSNEQRDKIEDLEVELAKAQLEVQQHKGAALLANRELAKKDDEIKDAITQRDQYANKIAQMITTNNTGTLAVGPATRKSAKIPDPPMLSDGKNPRFDDWLVLMEQKLSANADHYDTPELRRAYVASRCEGDAAKHIAKRLRENARDRYRDSNDLLKHLEQIYHDPNRIANAKFKFRELRMKGKDKFHDFLTEFIYWAEEAEVNRKDWKEELYQKITTELQKMTMAEILRTEGTFQEFADSCSQTANRLEVINSRIQRNRTFATRSSPERATSQKPSDNRGSRTTTPAIGLKKENKEGGRAEVDIDTRRLMKEGKCFNCLKPGHIARDCPEPKTAVQLKAFEKTENGQA